MQFYKELKISKKSRVCLAKIHKFLQTLVYIIYFENYKRFLINSKKFLKSIII